MRRDITDDEYEEYDGLDQITILEELYALKDRIAALERCVVTGGDGEPIEEPLFSILKRIQEKAPDGLKQILIALKAFSTIAEKMIDEQFTDSVPQGGE